MIDQWFKNLHFLKIRGWHVSFDTNLYHERHPGQGFELDEALREERDRDDKGIQPWAPGTRSDRSGVETVSEREPGEGV